jgi:hypothetical protein
MKRQLQIFPNPTFGLFTVITAILVFIIFTKQPVDADMWWHLKSGQSMWQQKTILLQDQFSFTKINQPWVNAFWLSDLLMYFLVYAGGFYLLITVIAAIGAATFLTIFLQTSGPLFIRSFVIILAAISASPGWTARPQVFSFILLALLNTWMEKWKRHQGPPLYLLPVFFIIWVNFHGGFIWGFLLLAAVIAGMGFDVLIRKNDDRIAVSLEIKKLILWMAVSMIAVSINPNGIAIWKLPFYTIDVSIAFIQEWFSPNFHLLEMQPFLWIIFLFILSLSLSEKKQSFVSIFKSLGFIYMAFVSQRNIPIAAIVVAPLIIENFSDSWSKLVANKKPSVNLSASPHPQRLRGSGIINISLIVLLTIAALGQIYIQASSSNIDRLFPSGAVSWIKENRPEGNMYNSYNWGGYLIYNLPLYPVFIDGRADLFGEILIEDWWDIANGSERSVDLLDSYKINFLLIEPDWPIVNILEKKNWEISYRDEISIILTRKQ